MYGPSSLRCVIAVCVLAFAAPGWGQDPAVTPVEVEQRPARDLNKLIGRSATGLALPNVPIDADLRLKAPRAAAWRDGATDTVLLDQGVDVAIGAYFFHAERAVAMVTPRTI